MSTSAGAAPSPAAYTSVYSSVHGGGCFAFPCDEAGTVEMHALSDRVRDDHLLARALVGRDFHSPTVVCRPADRASEEGGLTRHLRYCVALLEAAGGQRRVLAESCRPPRSYVRPLSNALRAFNTQWPLAPYGSVMKVAKPGHLVGRHGSIDARRAFPLMMQFHRSTMGKLSHPLPFHSLARRDVTKLDAPMRPIAWERADLPSARPIRRSPANPHGCWTSHSRFTVTPKIALTVKLRRELSATSLPSDLPSD